MRALFFIAVILVSSSLYAQPDFAVIDSISVLGNKKTRKAIVLREMMVHPGDTIMVEALPGLLERSEQLIMNTGLFNSAHIVYKNWEGATNRVHLQVAVEEAWYIYPVPLFELADRNFNVWWVEQGRSLNRINFGGEFAHLNISGRKDKLKLAVKYGYTRKYSLSYSLPYINKAQTVGLSADVTYLRNREINYATVDNKQEFYRDGENFLYERFRTHLGLGYRPGLNAFHDLALGYRQNRIGQDVVSELNPDFFLDGRTFQRFFMMSYQFTFDRRDVRPYPWKGALFYVSLEKDGLGIFEDRNALTMQAGYNRYFPMGSRWSFGAEASGKLSLIREEQPYNDNRALGFGNNSMHGYEFYIVDGMDMALLKTSLRFRLWETGIDFGKLIPISAFRSMPVRFHLSLNNDVGYANDPFTGKHNFLDNRMLWGGGLGLDIVLYYDKVIQIEYSFNDLMENGLFLHLNMNI